MTVGVSRRLEIVNVKGLHARASAKLVELVEAHDAHCTVRRDGLDAAGDSIMGLLMLAAAHGTYIEIETTGAEA
ncbi:MAG: HPr family phosphocarrier protein, partial [Pseudomonadota bacterium]